MSRALLLVCVLGAAAHADPEKSDKGVDERARVDVQPAGAAFKKIAIDNPLGDVRVEGYDGTAIRIETRKHAPDEDTLDRLRVSLVPNPDGTVRITTTADPSRESKPVPRSAVRIDLIIHAPRAAHVDAAVVAGKLDVENMDGGGELDAASGAIHVKNLSGELVTHSVSGTTSLAQVFGSVDAATVSADVELDTINGERLVASTSSRGAIAGRRVRSRDIELTTTDGRIALEAEPGLRGHIMVASLRGDLEVRVHRHGALVVRGHGVKVDLGAQTRPQADGWVETTFGQGSGTDAPALVELRSRYGAVQFAIVQ
jgi:hypothetical protein